MALPAPTGPGAGGLPVGGFGTLINAVTDKLNTQGGMGGISISAPQDILNSIFGDDVLYRIVRFMLTIIVSSAIVECGMWYHVRTIASSSPIMSGILGSVNQCFYICAFFLFMSMILLLYAIKKGVDDFDRATFTYYTSVMFILAVVRIALQTIATTAISSILNDPTQLVSYDPAVLTDLYNKSGFCKSPAFPIFIFTTLAWIISIIYQFVAAYL